MAYLTHDEYKALGGTLDAAAFAVQEFRARQLIDQLTHGRIKGEDPVREAVKHTARALIALQTYDEAHGGREVASESNDGLSVTYATTGPGGGYARRVDIVCDYLTNETTAAGVPLLYAGVDV
ncbi:MAG: hypothetical protein VB065_14045 [Eubacteriales bacterium]|nr:hypothetical protein [Christensenellaceae bacterium]MEA5067157.1 hypothetical protein [Eubacteriales bacterium]